MDAEILQGFIKETESYLPEICTAVAAYWQNNNAVSELENARRQTQTIKGAAAMMGLTEIAAISGELEAELKKILSARSIISDNQNQFLLDGISRLQFTLNLTRESIDGVFEKSNDPAESFSDILNFEEAAQTTDDFGKPNDNPQISGEFEEFEIDAEMLEVFAMEAEDLLQNIGSNLTTLEKTPNDCEALLEIRRSAHTLKGSAAIVGLKNLAALAHRVEDLLDYLAENEIESDKNIFELLLTSTDCLEVLMNGQFSAEVEQRINGIYQRFDVMMASLQTGEQVQTIDLTQDIVANKELETEDETSIKEIPALPENIIQPAKESRSVIRVSLERLDDLVKMVSEMVISRSVFEQKLGELELQIEELQHTTDRMRRATDKLETDFEAGALENGNSGFQVSRFSANGYKSASISKTQEFDTLELDHYTEFHQTTRELIETAGDTSSIHNELDNLLGSFNSVFDNQRRLIEKMQENLLRLRMIPLNSLASRLHRTIRVTANEEGKTAELEIKNGNIEIDTQILDGFTESLLHLLRNAVAHGIEPPETRRLLGKPEKGRIFLRVCSEGTHIVFIISDDGRGISVLNLKEKSVSSGFITAKEAATMTDDEAFSLVFLPGLSTAGEINQVSGRGVGMNIVKSSITRRQGTISIKSEPQKGTTFTIRLPMSLAVTRALFVKANERKFAFPLKIVKQIVEISPDELQAIAPRSEFKTADKSYKFFYFNELLDLPVTAQGQNNKIPILLIETSEMSCALAVDRLFKPEEIVIKPLGSLLQNVSEILGATILGDGSVVPVLDLIYLLGKKPLKSKNEDSQPAKLQSRSNVLIVDDSPSVRQINSHLMKNAGWDVSSAKDGMEALEILQTARELPDIILTDVEMPRMDGYELLAALKRQENLRSIPVVMITSRTSDKHRLKAFDLGASEYLSKPFEESILFEKIKKLMR